MSKQHAASVRRVLMLLLLLFWWWRFRFGEKAVCMMSCVPPCKLSQESQQDFPLQHTASVRLHFMLLLVKLLLLLLLLLVVVVLMLLWCSGNALLTCSCAAL